MIELALIFGSGVLGSAHCVGMCGGFVLTLGSRQPSWRSNLGRQVVYACGRICTYALLGAMLGFGGWRLNQEAGVLIDTQAVLSIIAGVVLVVEGAFAAGWLRRPWAGAAGCPGARGFAALLHAPHAGTVFAAGVLNGLLPCGLVYAYLALAASSGNVGAGAAIMAAFGLGTLPLLLVTGLSGGLLTIGSRRRLFHLAAWCMIATGAITIARGVQFFGNAEPDVCPLCISE